MTAVSTMLASREDEARALDDGDRAGSARDRFVIPKDDTDSGFPELCYFAGNSLGPQPVGAADDVRRELEEWATLVVEGHLTAQRPWGTYDEQLRDAMARVVGARPHEVVVMNSLTVNLHLLLASFYRPTKDRFKIVIEDAAFPSDSYAVASQVAHHGYEPRDGVVRLTPRSGERTLRTEDICAHLDRESGATAVLLLGGVNYLTGQYFDLPTITSYAGSRGVVVGWDLAHAAGNAELALHDWGPDFAAWCTYKYLNGGPGSTGGAFVHERHLGRADLPRLAGWWGTEPGVRFEMRPGIDPRATADAWAVSNPSVLSMAPLAAALAVFDDVTMPVARARSVRLTAYLESLLDEVHEATRTSIVTPRSPDARGSQLSVQVPGSPSDVVSALRRHGVVCDARRPDVVRMAPAPLFCTYHDCWRAARAMVEVLAS